MLSSTVRRRASCFLAEGIFSARVGGNFVRNILSKGDSEDPAELYRMFMGRDPDPRALLGAVGPGFSSQLQKYRSLWSRLGSGRSPAAGRPKADC